MAASLVISTVARVEPILQNPDPSRNALEMPWSAHPLPLLDVIFKSPIRWRLVTLLETVEEWDTLH